MFSAAPQKSTNLTLSGVVPADVQSSGIDPSQACGPFPLEVARSERARLWVQENSEFVAAYNRTVEMEGLPLEAWRSF